MVILIWNNPYLMRHWEKSWYSRTNRSPYTLLHETVCYSWVTIPWWLFSGPEGTEVTYSMPRKVSKSYTLQFFPLRTPVVQSFRNATSILMKITSKNSVWVPEVANRNLRKCQASIWVVTQCLREGWLVKLKLLQKAHF